MQPFPDIDLKPLESSNEGRIHTMSTDLEQRIASALKNPENRGELANPDAVGTVGNADCGDMLRVWIKFREEKGRKVIDRASFQSFGCETAIAAASLAMDLIKGKTAEEALSLSGKELAADLGPLPPTKLHCTQLVEGALRSALTSAPAAPSPAPAASTAPGSLSDALNRPDQKQGSVRVVFLDSKPV